MFGLRYALPFQVFVKKKADLEMARGGLTPELVCEERAQIAEPLPCPEWGKVRMAQPVETCRLADGLTVKRLRHYKCRSCGARFFDDDAMHSIQFVRASRATPARAC